MLGAAATADPVHVVLPHRDVYLGGIMHLVGALDADIACLRQLRPTPTAAFRSVRHLLIRHRHPWQRVARCALLLATSASPALRPPRKIIAGGRHGGVPAVSRGLPFQPPYPLLQRDVRLTQPRDRRGLIPTQGDQPLARQLLQSGHSPRSSPRAARLSRTDTRKITIHLNAYPNSSSPFVCPLLV